jgi:hypothetical protein
MNGHSDGSSTSNSTPRRGCRRGERKQCIKWELSNPPSRSKLSNTDCFCSTVNFAFLATGGGVAIATGRLILVVAAIMFYTIGTTMQMSEGIRDIGGVQGKMVVVDFTFTRRKQGASNYVNTIPLGYLVVSFAYQHNRIAKAVVCSTPGVDTGRAVTSRRGGTKNMFADTICMFLCFSSRSICHHPKRSALPDALIAMIVYIIVSAQSSRSKPEKTHLVLQVLANSNTITQALSPPRLQY